MKINRTSKSDEIINQLETLRETPPRDAEAAARGRAAFLKEAESFPQPVSNQRKWRLNLQGTQAKLQLRTLTIAILVIGTIFGTGAITASAAQTSLPGEQLYPIKIWIEDLKLTFAGSYAERLKLHLEFAAERLEELEEVSSQNTFELSDDFFSDLDEHISEAEALLLSGEGSINQDDLFDALFEAIEDFDAEDELGEPETETEEEAEDQSESTSEEIQESESDFEEDDDLNDDTDYNNDDDNNDNDGNNSDNNDNDDDDYHSDNIDNDDDDNDEPDNEESDNDDPEEDDPDDD